MVLDEPRQETWTQRLRRGSMDDCLASIEKVELTFFGGQTRAVYVGGILNDQIWTSYQINSKGDLEPHIERLPICAIREYRVLN